MPTARTVLSLFRDTLVPKRIEVLILLLIAVALALTATYAQSGFGESTIWAEVMKVERAQAFPEVAVTLKVITSSPTGYAGKTITIKPLYARDPKGRVYYDAAATRVNMAAYYLLPGDAISARAQRRGVDGVYDAADIKRLPSGQSAPASEEQKPMELSTDQTNYGRGEPVKISLVVTNTTRQPLICQFSSSQQYDFWALRDGREIWRWSRDRLFAQMLTSLALKPGESKTFAEPWNLRDDSGKPAPDGTYVIMGQLTTRDHSPDPVSKTITVGAKPISVGLSEIYANPDAYLGKTVWVSAVYYGRQPPQGIPGSDTGPPVTRSDWAVSDGLVCMYATGLSVLDPVNDGGKNIRVRAQVARTDKGQVYLKAEEVRGLVII